MQESQRLKSYSVERKIGMEETPRPFEIQPPKLEQIKFLKPLERSYPGGDSKSKLKTKLRVSKQNQIHGIRIAS